MTDDAGADATGLPIDVFQLVSDPADCIFELTNPDGMFTRYKGFNVQATKRMSNHWQLGGSLTFSESEGRLGSSRGGPAAAQSSLAGTFGQNPNDFVNTDGLLIGDRPVLAKAQLVVELPLGFTAAAAFQHQTGRPWGRRIRVAGLGVPTTIRAESIRRKPPGLGLELPRFSCAERLHVRPSACGGVRRRAERHQ